MQTGVVSNSISFDRAVDFYDASRALSPAATEEVTRLLGQELRGRGQCLEIGVGTGRVALHLGAGGVHMAGVDLSERMLRRLVEKSDTSRGSGDSPLGSTSLPLAVADATQLPFRSGSFGAGLACHVLHLIPGWRDAVTEVIRVVRSGGVFLLDPGGGPGGDWRAVFRHTSEVLGIEQPRVGLIDIAELDEFMRERGYKARVLSSVVDRATRPLADALLELQRRIYSWTWSIPPERMEQAVAATRDWAAAHLGDLDEPRMVEKVITWRAYDL